MKNKDLPSLIMAAVMGAIFSLTSVSATSSLNKNLIQENNNNVMSHLEASRQYTDAYNGTLNTIIVNAANSQER